MNEFAQQPARKRAMSMKLSTAVTLMIGSVIGSVLILVYALWFMQISGATRDGVKDTALTLADTPEVKRGLTLPPDSGIIQPLALAVTRRNGLLFAVVTNMDGIRYSHPNSQIIGKPFIGDDIRPTLAGKENVAVNHGVLAPALRVFTPVFDDSRRQIGVVAIGISLAVSLTLTPMMCGWLLKSGKPHEPTRKRGVGRLLVAIQGGYGKSLKWVLKHSRLTGLVLLGTIALSVWLYISIPKTFFPEQDTGVLMGGIQADQSISFQAMRGKLEDFMKIIREDPAVDNVTGFTGGSRVNSGMMFITLKSRDERHETAQQIIDRLRKKLAKEPGANLFLMAVQDIRVGGRQANASYQYTLLSDDLAALREWEPKIRKTLAALPELADVNSDSQNNGAEMDLIYDRDTMSRLGISVQDANNLLNNAFGQRQISTIYQPLNQYKVVMQVDPVYTQDVSALDKMFVINSEDKPIPLSYFAKWQPANAPLSVNHQGLSAASTISFNLPTGKSLSEASDAINRAMTQIGVPSSVRGSFAGTAQVFQETMNSQVILILAAIATVYIVLGILYESYVHPLTILSTIPSAGVGALLALELFDAPFSLIALIGIMLLIGIVKKNAIMMVDFALEAQRNGNLPPEEAIFQACLLRFRPIMMTTLAALFGALPLVISGGDGSELRQPLGITIVGGLVMSQLLTLYTTPVVYLFFDRLRLRFSRKVPQPVSE